MLNNLIIDDVDIYAVYGICLAENSLGPVVQMPPFKTSSYVVNDWQEQDGLDFDISAPLLDGKKFNLNFYVRDIRYVERLIDFLRVCSYRDWTFVELGVTQTLRLVEAPSISDVEKFGTMTLSVAQDEAYTLPTTSGRYPQVNPVTRLQNVSIDNHDIGCYGAWVLEGTDKSVRSAVYKVKPNLSRNISTVSGVIYNNDTVHMGYKDFTVNLLIHTANINDFWARYAALMGAITSADKKSLDFNEAYLHFHCFYKSNNVKRFVIDGGQVWCEFTVTFTPLAVASDNPIEPFLPGTTVFDHSFDLSFQ